VVVVGLFGLPILALFFGFVISSATKTGILLLFYPPKIKFVTRAFADRNLIYFGAKLVSAGVVVYLWFNMNVFVLGRINIDALGFYGLAYLWAGTPADISSATINRVMLPTYSALIRDRKPVFAGYMQTQRYLSVASFGAFVFLFVASPILLMALYGSSWEPAIPIILVLLVLGLGRTLLEPAGSLVYSLQRPGLILWTNVLNLALISIFVVPVADSYGALGCAALITIVYLIHICILWFIVFRTFHQSLKTMLVVIARPLIAAILALGIGTAILYASSGTLWTLVAVLAATSAYLILMYLSAKSDLLQTFGYVKHALGLKQSGKNKLTEE
jgi:PST family polysaccharide transporter/lipopolysaccharide exporter